MHKRSVAKAQLDQKKARFHEVIDTILNTCRTLGWTTQLERGDDENFQFATILVSKMVTHLEITASINLTVDDGVRYPVERTSFYDYGLKELRKAIGMKLGELDWLLSDKQEKQQEQQKEQKEKNEKTRAALIEKVLRNFDKTARQLRRRHNNRGPFEINDEYDVQDLLHAILRAFFDDIRAEEYTPSYAGASSRIDFLLKQEKTLIEVKYATKRLKEKKIGEQLIIDIQKYQAHPDCKALYCIVYDPDGNIRNPAGLENDLSKKHDELLVKVLVVPN